MKERNQSSQSPRISEQLLEEEPASFFSHSEQLMVACSQFHAEVELDSLGVALTLGSGVLGVDSRTSKGVGHPGEQNPVRLQLCHTLPGLDQESKFSTFLISTLREKEKKGEGKVSGFTESPGWRRPSRSSPALTPQLHPVTQCHFQAFFKHIQGQSPRHLPGQTIPNI